MCDASEQALFLRGKGIPFNVLYHLLEGSSKPLKPSPGQSKKYHDANLLWRGGSDDSEMGDINALETESGELAPSIRDLRTMVDFCCIWRYDYPENLLSTCSAIGQKKALPARCHYQVGVERGEELNTYATALKGWLQGEQLSAGEREKEITAEVFRILGPRDHLKEKLIERTYLSLVNRYFDCSFFGYDSTETKVPLSPFTSTSSHPPKNVKYKIYELESEITKVMGGSCYNFLGEVGGVEPPCHFKYVRRLLILIGSIGALKWRGYAPSIDPRMKGRRELTRLCLTALQSFFAGTYRAPDASIDKRQKELYEKIRELLGRPDALKKWLVYSLYKNVKNQTLYQAYTMKRWVEFVKIKDNYLKSLPAAL